MEPDRDPEGVEIEFLNWTGGIHGRKVLEIGFGNGRLAWRYAETAGLVAGVDPDAEKLASAAFSQLDAFKTPLIFAQAQAEELPFADEDFESVLLAWSL